WGDGPRIPIKAKIYLRRMDDSMLDPDSGDATWDQAGAALGPARLLWDWHDLNSFQRGLFENQRNGDAGNFVLAALNYKLNTGDEPPDCRNCHVERGGKRGVPVAHLSQSDRRRNTSVQGRAVHRTQVGRSEHGKDFRTQRVPNRRSV